MSTIADEISREVALAVKNRRERLGLTLRALASKSGVSSSMISDIERGAKSPTISTLSALAAALGVPISALVDGTVPAAERIKVVRAAGQSEFVDPTTGARRTSLGAALPGSKIQFMRYVVPPHTMAGPFAAHGSGTVEHMYMAAGNIRAEFGADAVLLDAGDSCSCIADTPHRFDNRASEVEAMIYIVVEQA